MKLRHYLDESGIKIGAFARKVKCTPATLQSIFNESHDVRLSLAIRIYRETKCKVKPEELLSEKSILGVEARKKASNTYINRIEENE